MRPEQFTTVQAVWFDCRDKGLRRKGFDTEVTQAFLFAILLNRVCGKSPGGRPEYSSKKYCYETFKGSLRCKVEQLSFCLFPYIYDYVG